MKKFTKMTAIIILFFMIISMFGLNVLAEEDVSVKRDLLYLTNGANVDNSTMPAKESKVEVGQIVTLNTTAVPQRPGYTFAGWSLTGGRDNMVNRVAEVIGGQANLAIDAYGRYSVYAIWIEGENAPVPPVTKDIAVTVQYILDY